jgi:D-serine deaminase-like pyridoxal phosphate-dependent protein
MEHATGALTGDPAFAPVLEALGGPGSVDLVPTPALLCDLDLLTQNIELMQRTADAARTGLRPHAKSHKSARIARMQLDAGATGICVAKLSEAEVLVAALGADDGPPVSVLVTSPLGNARSARRAAALAGRCDLSVVVDHVDGVAEVAAAASGGPVVTVLCDVDVGLGRTGVTGPGPALDIAARVEATTSLRFGGVQGYAGHAQHVAGRDLRRQVMDSAADRLAVVIDALESAGLAVDIRSGGGTGTALLDVERGVLNELQVGSYVFMDREYRDALDGDPESAFAQSLTLVTTVVSANQTGFVTVDAGLKAMATDAGVPAVVDHPGSTFAFFGDEQGLVTATDGWAPTRGERLALVPPHCDPTVDRHDRIWLTRGDVVIEAIPVTARGHSY